MPWASVNFCKCQKGVWLGCGGYSIPPARGKRGFFLWRKHGGGSRPVLCIGSGGRFLISLMFPVYCWASSSQLHPNTAGRIRESWREQCVVLESLSGGPKLGSTIPKPRHLGRAWRGLLWDIANVPRLLLKFTQCCRRFSSRELFCCSFELFPWIKD